MTVEFIPFPKMPRLNREIVITEKLDGTNAQIHFTDDGQMFVGSRNKWVEPGKQDNYGFAGWCERNRNELEKLGPGTHFGEWWGNGIQRGYELAEKRFSLFNTARWLDDNVRPACCGTVPVLYTGMFSEEAIRVTLKMLQVEGSQAAPGFMKPEGIIIYHTAAQHSFKVTLEKDESPKGMNV